MFDRLPRLMNDLEVRFREFVYQPRGPSFGFLWGKQLLQSAVICVQEKLLSVFLLFWTCFTFVGSVIFRTSLTDSSFMDFVYPSIVLPR